MEAGGLKGSGCHWSNAARERGREPAATTAASVGRLHNQARSAAYRSHVAGGRPPGPGTPKLNPSATKTWTQPGSLAWARVSAIASLREAAAVRCASFAQSPPSFQRHVVGDRPPTRGVVSARQGRVLRAVGGVPCVARQPANARGGRHATGCGNHAVPSRDVPPDGQSRVGRRSLRPRNELGEGGRGGGIVPRRHQGTPGGTQRGKPGGDPIDVEGHGRDLAEGRVAEEKDGAGGWRRRRVR